MRTISSGKSFDNVGGQRSGNMALEDTPRALRLPRAGADARVSRTKTLAKAIWNTRPVRTLVRNVPDRMAVSAQYLWRKGRLLQLRDPRTFNEKIQWIKLNYRTRLMTQVVDKHDVRRYVQDVLGEHALNEIYGVWDRPDEVDFESLPDSFVLKVTSGSGANIICDDKGCLDSAEARKKLSGWMAKNYYYHGREWPYRDVRPRIIAERLMLDETGKSPPDFKFFCFNGKPTYVQVDTSRFAGHARDYFDADFLPAPFTTGEFPASPTPISKPPNFDEMRESSAKLSAKFPFARVDLYSFRGRTIFGEITFSPDAGCVIFEPDCYDSKLGDLLDLAAIS